MFNLNRNTRLFFFQYIFQRDYTKDFELEEFVKQNLKKRPCNKKKLKSLYQSFLSNYDHIKGLIDSEILKKTNKITIFLIYAFFSEYLINKEKKKILCQLTLPLPHTLDHFHSSAVDMMDQTH